ncbi:MAG: carboxypeptidase-like regulatory domain-containing protein [Vicingaceae bacterium]|nr:carboxypeptidase-like regulatory domain-containing protein [Vicingaceae bacterium]
MLSADAKTGYYSSSGRTENGTHNIYTVSPGHFGKRPILALVVGVTKANGEPVDADITVTNDKTGELAGKYKSNSSTGKYMLALTPGNKYKIAIEVEGYETKIDYLDIEDLETYVQVEHDFELYSKEQVEGVSVTDDEDELQGKIDTQIEKYKYENTKEGYIETAFKKVLNNKGSDQVEGVEYYIEPTDIEKVKNVKGVAERSMVKIGTDEVVIGPFKTLLEAELFRSRLSQQDSMITSMNIKVDDDGVEKSLYQHYPNEFHRNDYNEEISLHEKITQKDKVKEEIAMTEEERKAKELTEDGEVDLKSEDLVNAREKTITGLSFKVEVGAVKDPADFKLGYLEKYGNITAKKYPDGTTRYTFGPFETLAEAEGFRQMLIEKEKEAEDAFVTVFVFGQRKTLEEYQKTTPCGEGMEFIDFSDFIGKDLNDKTIYNKLIKLAGNICADGLVFKVQIAAYRFPDNYKWNHLKQFGKPEINNYPDGITRFTQGNFDKIGEAEELRQKIIQAGQKDAWITPFYNGKRMLLEELIEQNFYQKKIN